MAVLFAKQEKKTTLSTHVIDMARPITANMRRAKDLPEAVSELLPLPGFQQAFHGRHSTERDGVCVCVCVFVCMCVFVSVSLCLCICLNLYVCLYVLKVGYRNSTSCFVSALVLHFAFAILSFL